MEHNIIPIKITKRIWNLVRVFFQLARKVISHKRQLLWDLNLLLKRGKIAGKAVVRNLIHRHHQQQYPLETTHEINCNDRPANQVMLNFIHHHLPALHIRGKNKHRKRNNKNSEIKAGLECPEILFHEENYEAVNRVLDALAITENEEGTAVLGSMSSSNSLNYYSLAAYNLSGLGFDRCMPGVRQLRVTDSPFPLANNEDDRRVDEAAEEFISRFYSQLKQQMLTPAHPNGAN